MKNILRRGKKDNKVDEESKLKGNVDARAMENYNSNNENERLNVGDNQVVDRENEKNNFANQVNQVNQANQGGQVNQVNQMDEQANSANKPMVAENSNLNPNNQNFNNIPKSNVESNLLNPSNVNTSQVKPKEENIIQKEFKNIFQGQDFFSNNTYRKRLMHFTFACIIVDILILQALW
jgi:hypothetical protein